MTREEAITLMKSAQLMLVNPKTNEPISDLYAALDMAIQALKQEPCDDAVSRQALLEFFKDDDYVVNEINNMPSVLPKREQGEWIEQSSNKEQGEREHIWWKCSQCGQVIFSETERDRKEFHAFCSKCGAEMR